jgi:hypothetical protein
VVASDEEDEEATDAGAIQASEEDQELLLELELGAT